MPTINSYDGESKVDKSSSNIDIGADEATNTSLADVISNNKEDRISSKEIVDEEKTTDSISNLDKASYI
eukprot:Nk52_evm1s2140 gene=Nk52_evmTU1s2140